jgi:uncharacterized protein YcfJ
MKLLITSALLFLVVTPLAQAHHDNSYHDRSGHSRGEFKTRVINSTPVYKYITVRQPQTYCEPSVTRKPYAHSHNRRSHNNGATLVGGIVGGVIGHTASDQRHKGLGTIIGAVIGSSLAHSIESSNKKDSRTYQFQPQNCVVTYKKNRKVRVLDGYKVTYRSKGKLYRTFRQDKPSRYIRIFY